VDPKCKNLVPRACKNIIPVRENLQRKMPNIDPICPCCKKVEKTIEHIFLESKEVMRVWFANRMSIHLLDHIPSFNQWLASCFDMKDMMSLQQVFRMFLSIWRRRNKQIFEERKTPLSLVIN